MLINTLLIHTKNNIFHHLSSLLVPYRWNRGNYRFPRRLSVSLSVCPHVCQSVHSVSVHSVFRTFSVVLWVIDLKFGIWICLDIIQIKFEFRHAWPTFTRVIALCLNLVFPTFLCHLFRYSLEIWYIDWSCHKIDQVCVSSRLTYFNKSYCSLLKIFFKWICHDIIQIKFGFATLGLLLQELLALC